MGPTPAADSKKVVTKIAVPSSSTQETGGKIEKVAAKKKPMEQVLPPQVLAAPKTGRPTVDEAENKKGGDRGKSSC